MALIGLSLWCRRLPPKETITAIQEYTILIHPNEMVVMSNCFYALMVQYLLNNIDMSDLDRPRKAFEYAKSHLLEQKSN